MGADATMVFFGVRFAISEDESERLDRKDRRIRSAVDHKLDHWWGNFAVDHNTEQMFLYIGKKLVRIGYEDDFELSLALDELRVLAEDCEAKLKAAGFSDKPQLYVQFEPDY